MFLPISLKYMQREKKIDGKIFFFSTCGASIKISQKKMEDSC